MHQAVATMQSILSRLYEDVGLFNIKQITFCSTLNKLIYLLVATV